MPNLNDCGAVVTFVSATQDFSKWKLLFHVKTNCDFSTGRFQYNYRELGTSEPADRQMQRWSPSWTAAEGREFQVVDSLNFKPGATPEFLSVEKIESLRI